MDYQTLINKSIKDLRKKHDLTQEQFCEKIGKLRHFFNAFVFIVFCVVAFAVTLPPTCN